MPGLEKIHPSLLRPNSHPPAGIFGAAHLWITSGQTAPISLWFAYSFCEVLPKKQDWKGSSQQCFEFVLCLIDGVVANRKTISLTFTPSGGDEKIEMC